MPQATEQNLQRQLAREGAATRVQRILTELAQIYQMFPELKGQEIPRGLAPVKPVGRRQRRPPTATDRRKISTGMRKYWARRKAKQAKASRHAD